MPKEGRGRARETWPEQKVAGAAHTVTLTPVWRCAPVAAVRTSSLVPPQQHHQCAHECGVQGTMYTVAYCERAEAGAVGTFATHALFKADITFPMHTPQTVLFGRAPIEPSRAVSEKLRVCSRIQQITTRTIVTISIYG